MGKEHRDTRAVLARIKNLLDLVVFRLKLYPALAKQAALPQNRVISVDGRWRGKTGKTIECFRLVALAAETCSRTDAGQFHLPDERAVQIKHLDLRFGVFQVM